MTIAEKLVEARGKIPRKTVCEAIGIALSTLSMYENGERVPRDRIKLKLANFYQKDIKELFYEQN
jgi:transcriptional regulator with XRE-family HTH domain